MIWSNNEHWMLTGDHNGFVKYWQSNMNNVKVYQAHNDPVRGLTYVKMLQFDPKNSILFIDSSSCTVKRNSFYPQG